MPRDTAGLLPLQLVEAGPVFQDAVAREQPSFARADRADIPAIRILRRIIILITIPTRKRVTRLRRRLLSGPLSQSPLRRRRVPDL
jgi:hypothetical protein